MKVQEVILKREPSKHDTVVLKKTLSRSYPSMPINEAIQKENEKLQLELQRSQANLDVSHCEFIQHLLEVTEVVASESLSEKSSPTKPTKKLEHSHSDVNSDKEHNDRSYTKSDEKQSTSRFVSFIDIIDP